MLAVEVFLRQCIAKKYGQEKKIVKLKDCKQGDVVPKNALFNCDSLYNVIEKFNCEFENQVIRVDRDKINRLRRALAHGKFISSDPYPLKLYNFIEEDKNHVRVDFIEEMTDNFMDENIKYIYYEFKKISNLYKRLK